MTDQKPTIVVEAASEKKSSQNTSKSYHDAFDFWGLTPFLNDIFAVKAKPWLKATKEGWVHWIPLVIGFFVILGVLAIGLLLLAALGLSTFGTVTALADGGLAFLTGLFLIPAVVVGAVYFYFLNQIRADLSQKLAKGWVWFYYLTLANLVLAVLRFDPFSIAICVGTLWILFQIKEYYK